MKSINDLYQEVKSDEGLRSKLFAAYGKGEIEGFLKENDCDATAEEAQKFIEQELRSGSGKLSDEELALVVGGKGNSKPSGQPKYQKGMTVIVWFAGPKDLSGSYYDYTIVDIREGNGVWEYRVKSPSGDLDWVPEKAIVDVW